MIDNNITYPKKIYYHMSTNNKSFLDMHNFLKAKGIQNNKFFLVLLDPDLAGVDPRDPRLNAFMKQKILRECINNYWYFIREVVRIPDQGGTKGSGVRYKLHRANLAFNFCVSMNMNIFYEIPRQQGKTAAVITRLLWEYNFGSVNSECIMVNKKHEDSKLNLQRLKDYRDALPSYLQMAETFGKDGKKIKATNTIESIQHPLNGNRIKTLPAARNKVAANGLGRGMTIPRMHLEEWAFVPFNETLYLAAVPAFKTASMNAKKNGAPYGIIITTTPGDLTTDEGNFAFSMKEDATKFSELWYDMSYTQLEELIAANTNSSFVYIRYTYQQLGLGEDWFKSMVIDMQRKWPEIRREVLLEWAKTATNSPFRKEDLDIVKSLIKEPIKQIMFMGKYLFNIYEEIQDIRRYPPLIGVDVSGGFNRDSSAITVVDSRTTRVVADLNCNYISTVDLAKVIYQLVSNNLPNAIVNIERNGGFGASVLSKLVTTSIKKNLFYEIKDKVVEERALGANTIRKTVKTKVYGLDSTKNTRDLLMQILKERMEYHKDKFISPYIYEELETLEVKRNGKIEHANTGHDDQIFSYLMALYIWYEGKDLMERWGLQKGTIKTDEDIDETYESLEDKYDNIVEQLDIMDDESPSQVKAQLDYLNSVKAISFEDWMHSEYEKDEKAMEELLSTKLGRKAYKEKFNDPNVSAIMQYKIPDSVFNDFYQ